MALVADVCRPKFCSVESRKVANRALRAQSARPLIGGKLVDGFGLYAAYVQRRQAKLR
jgi:hypothetical protein